MYVLVGKCGNVRQYDWLTPLIPRSPWAGRKVHQTGCLFLVELTSVECRTLIREISQIDS